MAFDLLVSFGPSAPHDTEPSQHIERRLFLEDSNSQNSLLGPDGSVSLSGDFSQTNANKSFTFSATTT